MPMAKQRYINNAQLQPNLPAISAVITHRRMVLKHFSRTPIGRRINASGFAVFCVPFQKNTLNIRVIQTKKGNSGYHVCGLTRNSVTKKKLVVHSIVRVMGICSAEHVTRT
jgi:hypothetical protein